MIFVLFMNVAQALKVLSESKHRITKSRESILRTIFKLKSPFSANDIVAAHAKKFDLVTVYRNLKAFEETGIICRADFSDDMTRYMISEPGHDHHHHHIVCRECHEIQPVDFCIIEAQEQVLKKLGFTNISHRLEFSGVCPSCSD